MENLKDKRKNILLKLVSGKINLTKESNPEFDDFNWVTFWYPLHKVVDFKKNVYRKALNEFKDFLN